MKRTALALLIPPEILLSVPSLQHFLCELYINLYWRRAWFYLTIAIILWRTIFPFNLSKLLS